VAVTRRSTDDLAYLVLTILSITVISVVLIADTWILITKM
jgi:hypothetical protein